MRQFENSKLRVGIGGLGAIGTELIHAFERGIEGLELRAVSARDVVRAEQLVAKLALKPVIVPLTQLAQHADIVVECAPAAVYDEIARPAIDAGRILVTMSSGALLARADLIEKACRTGARIIVPSGGILGLDALKAVAEGEIHAVTLITRKPPRSLMGAPYLIERGISLDGCNTAMRIFDGNAREAAAAFPANANVAATLSLAGIGPERTRVEIWADPALTENIQNLQVKSASADFEIRLASRPLPDNPRTGSLTPKSVIATLRSLASHLTIGTP